MAKKLPKALGGLMEAHPEVWDAYSKLGEACAGSGPLEPKTRRLVKLALAIGAGSEGAVHSHTRQARDEGCSSEEISQVALLAITTLGFPRAVASLTWIGDIINKN